MKADVTLAYARLNARILPMDRGARYEDPLSEALEGTGFGEVSGGGTMQTKEGEVQYCGIDVDFVDLENGVPLVCSVLTKLGAPRGSALEFNDVHGEKVQVPFGEREGLAIYLNGTDLPKHVYENSDINEICRQICELLGDCGAIEGHWQGPTETALYLYGRSVAEMRELLAPCLAATPLCERARLVDIA